MRKKVVLHLLTWVSLFVGSSCFSFPLFAKTPNCSNLYRQKKFVQAGTCFETKANGMGETNQLSKIQKYLKGQSLRNAALSFRKAAATEQNAEKAAYRHEQALLILRRYLKENLCQKAYLCKLAKGEILELLNKIKYVQLSIVTTPKQRAILQVQGYKFNIRHFSPPQWNKQVRPGHYKLKVQYEGKKPLFKEIIALPGKALTVTMLLPASIRKQPSKVTLVRKPLLPRKRPKPLPPPKPKTKLFPFLLIGGGVLVVGAGAAILIYGKGQQNQRDQLYKKLKKESLAIPSSERPEVAGRNGTIAQKTQMDKLHQEAASLLLPGWLLVGAGSAIVLTGMTLHAIEKLSHRKKKKTQTPPPKPTSPNQSNTSFKRIHVSF